MSLVEAGTDAGCAIENDLRLVQPLSLSWIPSVLLLLLCWQWRWQWRYSWGLRAAWIAEGLLLVCVLHPWRGWRRGAIAVG